MSSKKKLSNKNANTLISNFFPTTKKSDAIEDQIATTPLIGNESDIYIKSLENFQESKKKPHEPSAAVDSSQIKQLQEYIFKLELEIKDEKKSKQKLAVDYQLLKRKYVANLQLLVKTQGLLINHTAYVNKMTHPENKTPEILTDGPIIIEAAADICKLISPDQLNLSEYLSDENIKGLNLVKTSKNHDAAFIRTLVDLMYKDKSELFTRSITGRSRTDKINKPMTPEKVNVIRHLFSKRISNSSADAEEKICRLQESSINRLVSNTLGNLRRSKSTVTKSAE